MLLVYQNFVCVEQEFIEFIKSKNGIVAILIYKCALGVCAAFRFCSLILIILSSEILIGEMLACTKNGYFL